MKINHQKAKERLGLIGIILFAYIIIVEPIIKWYNLSDTHPLSAWYFTILLPLLTFIGYAAIFLIIYLIISGVMWILGIEDKE